MHCEGKNKYAFLAVHKAHQGLLVFLTVIVAYETQKHVPKQRKYQKYHESAVINLTTILAIVLSSICQAVLIVLQLNRVQDGILLIIILRDCLWMYPMIYLLFIPKVATYIAKSYSYTACTIRFNCDCVCVCVCLRLSVSVYMSVYLYVCLHVCLYPMCVSFFVCVCVHACV